uniref:Piezo non-specific cation channel cap domain-containing protein n=1 Tax=Sphenodon punctatus TaxID=8508 RepID=A0A8D0GHR1_SPHPU
MLPIWRLLTPVFSPPQPLFTMSAQQQSIKAFTPQDYDALTNQFERQPVAMQFITLYGYEDVVRARIEGSSGSLWSISPPSREQLRRELRSNSSDITLRFTWSFQRWRLVRAGAARPRGREDWSGPRDLVGASWAQPAWDPLGQGWGSGNL